MVSSLNNSNTELKFCEYCGSPLFDYGNVCKACGKEQPKREAVSGTGYNSAANGTSVSGVNSVQNVGTPVVGSYNSAVNGGNSGANYNQPYNAGAANQPYNSGSIQSRFCEKCGSTLDEATGKCPRCDAASAVIPAKAPKEKSGRSVFPLVGFIVCGSLLVVAVVIIIIMSVKLSNLDKETERFYDDALYYKAQCDNYTAEIEESAQTISNLQSELDSANATIDDYSEDIDILEERNSELQEEYDALYESYLDIFYDYAFYD